MLIQWQLHYDPKISCFVLFMTVSVCWMTASTFHFYGHHAGGAESSTPDAPDTEISAQYLLCGQS